MRDHLWKCGEHCVKGAGKVTKARESVSFLWDGVSYRYQSMHLQNLTDRVRQMWSEQGAQQWTWPSLRRAQEQWTRQSLGEQKRLQNYTKCYRPARNTGRRSGLAQKRDTNWLLNTKGQSALKAFTQVTWYFWTGKTCIYIYVYNIS